MKEKTISAVVSLLKVKSIITLLSFGAFFYLSVTEKITTDNFMLILGMIATYFFNKDGNTKGGANDVENSEEFNNGKGEDENE